ncbi:hypothetical protein [Streptomyces olivochromogenes]|uniref:hypothetical protein n=1 Tax=Streptomyces olivochromogenes TaxID=1963 RepID=UPI003690CA5F
MSVSRTTVRLIAICMASGALVGAAAMPALADQGGHDRDNGRSYSHRHTSDAVRGDRGHGGDRDRGWYRDRGHDRDRGWYRDHDRDRDRFGDHDRDRDRFGDRDRGRRHGWYDDQHRHHDH